MLSFQEFKFICYAHRVRKNGATMFLPLTLPNTDRYSFKILKILSPADLAVNF